MLLLSAIFYARYLWIDLAAIIAGTTPQEITDNGLVVNPINVMDMAFALPSMLIAGVFLLRRHGLGYSLGSVLLVFVGTLAIAVGAMIISTWASGLSIAWPMVAVFVSSAIVSVVIPVRLFARLRPEWSLNLVLCRREEVRQRRGARSILWRRPRAELPLVRSHDVGDPLGVVTLLALPVTTQMLHCTAAILPWDCKFVTRSRVCFVFASAI